MWFAGPLRCNPAHPENRSIQLLRLSLYLPVTPLHLVPAPAPEAMLRSKNEARVIPYSRDFKLLSHMAIQFELSSQIPIE
jgi:hypothetical protein